MIELLLEAERALSMGRADRAELLYQQVAASDPRNSIAIVGLARVALERSDDAGALVLGRRALAIDGENVAAQRLVQRLEEVLQTRGEALPAMEAAPESAPESAPAGEASPDGDPSSAPSPWAGSVPPFPLRQAPLVDPPPSRATPFDGPDPVLGPAQRGAGAGSVSERVPASGRRSLLDRLRGR